MENSTDQRQADTGRGRRRRRRFPPFLAVPITLGLFFWLLAWAIGRANEFGLL